MSRIVKTMPFTGHSGNSSSTIYGLVDHCLVHSESNPKRNGRYVSGGGFYVTKRNYGFGHGSVKWRLYGADYSATPTFGFWSNIPPYIPPMSDRQSEYNSAKSAGMSFGATGWARARPGNPTASVFQTGVELYRDIPRLPLLLFYRLRNLSSLGSEYLNVQFGWKPLLNDIRKMYNLYHDIDKRLAQLIRENGKGIHRRRLIRDSNTTTSTTQTFSSPFNGFGFAPSMLTSGTTVITDTTTVTDKVWFEGKFRYYVPDIGSSQWTSRARRVLWGVNPTPHAVYSVIPWSWLIGWFANVGDVVSNASSNAVDNLTADYAYVMRTQETLRTRTAVTRWTQYGSPGGYFYTPAGTMTLSGTDQVLTKLRVQASPFGFGVTFDGLSGYQASIAAALGISRTRF